MSSQHDSRACTPSSTTPVRCRREFAPRRRTGQRARRWRAHVLGQCLRHRRAAAGAPSSRAAARALTMSSGGAVRAAPRRRPSPEMDAGHPLRRHRRPTRGRSAVRRSCSTGLWARRMPAGDGVSVSTRCTRAGPTRPAACPARSPASARVTRPAAARRPSGGPTRRCGWRRIPVRPGRARAASGTTGDAAPRTTRRSASRPRARSSASGPSCARPRACRGRPADPA